MTIVFFVLVLCAIYAASHIAAVFLGFLFIVAMAIGIFKQDRLM